MKKNYTVVSFQILIITFIIGCLVGCGTTMESSSNSFDKTWQLYESNPIIGFGNSVSGMIWNDPCVIKEGASYRMWLSGGRDVSPNHVEIYHATSSDGLQWAINTNSIIEPGSVGTWDDNKVETPSVIKVGNTYHMYYSGFKSGDGPGQYQTGHATSSDGVSWLKDPNNPVISFHTDLSNWGFYQSAEPGAVYDSSSDTIYLYYMTSKLRNDYNGSNPDLSTLHGICVATSPGSDGSNFANTSVSNRVLVLSQSQNYPVEQDFRGYSTPYAMITSDGKFHLFYDVAKHPQGGDWQQVALAHAHSSDGISFEEIEANIIKVGDESWLNTEVRAPSVLQTGDSFKMWFAGHTDISTSGIGYATYLSDVAKCQAP